MVEQAVGDDEAGAARASGVSMAFCSKISVRVSTLDVASSRMSRRRFAEHGAGNGQQLLLPAGEVRHVVADNGVVALRQRCG